MTDTLRRFDMIDDQMADLLRSKTETERLAIGHGLWRSARQMICNMLHANHPDWSEDQVHREAARRLSHGAV